MLDPVELHAEEPYVSPTVGNPNIDLSNIMELAIQLMPNDVPEFLDGVQEILSEKDNQQEAMPEYNYSTIRI